MNEVLITNIRIDTDGRLCVTPTKEDFSHIYRAAKEISWDSVGKFLFSPTPRDWTYAQWFAQILSATASEYGCNLKIAESTSWQDVDAETKALILASHHS